MAKIYIPKQVRNIKRLNTELSLLACTIPLRSFSLWKSLWGEERVKRGFRNTRDAGRGRLRRWASISLACVMSCHSKTDRSGLEISINLVFPNPLQDTRGWIRQSGTDKVMCEEGSRSISYTFITEWESRLLAIQRATSCSNQATVQILLIKTKNGNYFITLSYHLQPRPFV